MPNFRLGALRENVAEATWPQPRQPRSLESQLLSPTTATAAAAAADIGFAGGSCSGLSSRRQTSESSRPLFLSLQLNSEYRSTFQWHDLARPSALKQDVIRKPPSSKDYGKRCSTKMGELKMQARNNSVGMFIWTKEIIWQWEKGGLRAPQILLHKFWKISQGSQILLHRYQMIPLGHAAS